MAKDIFVISDTHFGHHNIIEYCNRPFKDIDHMDEAMIQNWNSVVKPGDKVYHLGDVYMGDGDRMAKNFPRLNGKKRLILGNHDDLKRKMGVIKLGDVFEKVGVWRMMPEFGLLLTHIPVHESALTRSESKLVWSNEDQKYEKHEQTWKLVNVHGHIHDNPSPKGPYKCVCVEQINYTPVNIEELRVR